MNLVLSDVLKMTTTEAKVPQIALLGAGIFARTQYIPRLRELADHVVIKAIWSLDEESAKAAVELASDFSPKVECKWGDLGLEDIIKDTSIQGVAVVLAAQVLVDISLKMLRAGKHVIQGTSEAEVALSCYKSFCNSINHQPIWAVAENFRFEPALVEARKLINEIGNMMNIQVVVEGYVNSSNPYFSSSWRRNLSTGFIMDMAVHYIAGLRMITRCEITTVAAHARYVNTALPPPDNLCALLQLENGCAGVFVMAVCSTAPKVLWRVDGTKGMLQVERVDDNGCLSYLVQFSKADGYSEKRSTHYPECMKN